MTEAEREYVELGVRVNDLLRERDCESVALVLVVRVTEGLLEFVLVAVRDADGLRDCEKVPA